MRPRPRNEHSRLSYVRCCWYATSGDMWNHMDSSVKKKNLLQNLLQKSCYKSCYKRVYDSEPLNGLYNSMYTCVTLSMVVVVTV